jgi:uncharacterized protein YrrD
MLQKLSDINGYTIVATDGELGTVADILFDDKSWRVRWLVVDTGGWLSGRKVLLPPSALGHLNPKESSFSVRLTRQQVRESPDEGQDLPVSRQMESRLYDYYGWSPYWSSGFYMGGYGVMGADIPYGTPPTVQGENYETLRPDGDLHLRSAAGVTGYHVHATDGEIGHIKDLLLEDGDWTLRYLVIDTSNWWVGKHVVISPRSVRDIDWSGRLVDLRVDRDTIQKSPLYDDTITLDRGYEQTFHRYYDDAGD